MTRHRDFDIKRFVAAVPTEDLRRFFDVLGVSLPDSWASLHGGALDEWLKEPAQAEIEPLARQHLRRINDLGSRASGALIAACRKYEVEVDGRESLEALALRLFVYLPDAFGYAWGRYLLYTNVENLAEYYYPAGLLTLDTERLSGLKEALRRYFEAIAKGRQLRIESHEDEGELIIIVQRGDYVRTLPLFAEDSDEISYRNFRPAVDDLIVYDPARRILRIKASTDNERRGYLWQFSHHFVGRDELYDTALNERVYTLEPIQDDRFSYSGSGDILEVKLARARIQLGPKEYAEYQSDDVRATLASRLHGISLRSGPLLSASLLFSFHGRRRPVPVRCDIRPPLRGKIPDNQYGAAIEAYLRAQGVKLR